jgi:hypothetical protein
VADAFLSGRGQNERQRNGMPGGDTTPKRLFDRERRT